MDPSLLIIPAFVLWWAFVLNLVALMGGWWTLARHYPAHPHFDGTRFRMRSAQIGWSNYGGILTVGINADGLSLAVFFLFRPGHPPLFIPWTEIDATFTKGWLFHYLDLRFRQTPHVRVRFQKSFGLKIAAAANRSWNADEPTTNAPEA